MMNQPPATASATTPATVVSPAPRNILLAMSGGGYRATLFHLGALYRLNQLGLLPRLSKVSSVSGGSITSAWLAHQWPELSAHFDAAGACPDEHFERIIVKPLWDLCRLPLDVLAFFGGMLRGGAANHFARLLDYWLLKDYKLAALPERDSGPVFIFNSTCLNSGTCIQFTRSSITDGKTVCIPADGYHVAQAVAASAAFPPILSPMTLRYDPQWNLDPIPCQRCQRFVKRKKPEDCGVHDDERKKQRKKKIVKKPGANVCHCGQVFARMDSPLTTEERLDPWRNRMSLTDGGIFDNVGLEALWHEDDNGGPLLWLSSDASGFGRPKRKAHSNWFWQIYRAFEIYNQESYNLRIRYFLSDKMTREVVDGQTSAYKGAYWRISDCIEKWRPGMQMARVPTRLCDFGDCTMRQLINWGYLCSAYSISRWTRGPAPEPSLLIPRKPLAPPFPEDEYLFGPLERKKPDA